MSETNKFQEEFALANRMGEFTPEQFVQFANGLCLAVEALDTPFYGGVNAENVSFDEDGNVGIGDALEGDNTRYTAEQIEYLAPEVFWNNEKSTQADVYSIGLMLYTWANAGCLPFLYPGAQATDRAEALRRRMSGEAFEKSPISKTLNRVLDKATAFKAEDRYESVAELREAFAAFAEEVETDRAAMVERMEALKARQAREAKMMANILAAAEAAAAAEAEAEKFSEKPKRPAPARNKQEAVEPENDGEKKMSARPLVAVLLIAAILMVAAVAMQFGTASDSGDNNANNNNENHSTIDTTPNFNNNGENPFNNNGENSSNNSNNTTPIVPSANPLVPVDITPTPAPFTPLPQATPVVPVEPTPVPGIDTSRYKMYKADITWNDAANNCIQNGGHLVSIANKDEFSAITLMADKMGLEYVWVGGFRKSGNIVWLDGTSSDYIPWAKGEPSYKDKDGEQENFLMLMKVNGVWQYNDCMDNPATKYPSAYSGKMGYVFEK